MSGDLREQFAEMLQQEHRRLDSRSLNAVYRFAHGLLPVVTAHAERQADTVRAAVLALADKWEVDAGRADDAEPVNPDGLTRMIVAARYLRMNAADLRAVLTVGRGQC